MGNTHLIPLTVTPEEPNSVSLEAIREGDSFLASEKKDVLTMLPILSQRRWSNERVNRRNGHQTKRRHSLSAQAAMKNCLDEHLSSKALDSR